MAQKNRTKEIWLVPKRVNLHQTVCLIQGLIERKYDGTSWNSQKQNNLGVNLKKWGATKSGKNISSQSIRTLVASVPQYLGFLFINTATTPNTICLTEAGKKLYKTHKEALIIIPNLVEGADSTIKNSEVVLAQMEKLQLTNPIYLKDCENILVFPFRLTLRMLIELDYLDREEIAMFLFNTKDESEINFKIKEIRNFRLLTESEREQTVELFKNTHVGNITLVQAPSASYYESLCALTGIIERITIKPSNQKKIAAIIINSDRRKYVEDILDSKYANAKTYDFRNNLGLWIEYIGNPERVVPPVPVELNNHSSEEVFICIKKDGIVLEIDVIEANAVMYYPMFIEEKYEVETISVEDGSIISDQAIEPTYKIQSFNIVETEQSEKQHKISDITEDIMAHSKCKNFSGAMLNRLRILERLTGTNKVNDKALRGAYYEYLFYTALRLLEAKGLVDDVIWNGRIGKYGLPSPAPGGKTGTPDMVFIIGDIHYVLEVTTIKAKSAQEKAEVASVPDHIIKYKAAVEAEVIGVFCAPIIHKRNCAVMKTILKDAEISMICISDKELINVFSHENRSSVINAFQSYIG